MRRSTLLSLPLQLVFPGCGLISKTFKLPPKNVKLAPLLRILPRTNTLAYFARARVTPEKKFCYPDASSSLLKFTTIRFLKVSLRVKLTTKIRRIWVIFCCFRAGVGGGGISNCLIKCCDQGWLEMLIKNLL